MNDSYQAVYDAVRSRISNANVGDAVAEACRNAFDISHARAILQEQFCATALEMARPSVVFKPTIQADGDIWTVLLGPDPQIGVFATGTTPAEAMANFDQEFWKAKPPKIARQERIDNSQFGVGA